MENKDSISALHAEISVLAHRVVASCRDKGLTITAAESCTGGLLCAAITSVAGASDVFEGGFITYSNECKMRVLGVSKAILDTYGAVSAETARAMAEGVRGYSDADLGLGITGIAGPGGGNSEKPVGLVYIACSIKEGDMIHERCLFGDESRNVMVDRETIRLLSVRRALSISLCKKFT